MLFIKKQKTYIIVILSPHAFKCQPKRARESLNQEIPTALTLALLKPLNDGFYLCCSHY